MSGHGYAENNCHHFIWGLTLGFFAYLFIIRQLTQKG